MDNQNNNPFIPRQGTNVGGMTPPPQQNFSGVAPLPSDSDVPSFKPAPLPTQQNGKSQSGSFEIDLTDVTSSYLIPEGTYRVRCIDVEQSVSKSGNPMFVWTFVVIGTPNAGHELKVFTAITPAAMWKVAEVVIALGIGQTGQTVKFQRSDVINRECGAMVETSKYNDKDSSSITKVISLMEMQQLQTQG